MDDERELAYLLAVSGAAVWTPRPLVAMLATLGSARGLVAYAKHAATVAPPPCEILGSEALARIAALDDAAARAALEQARLPGQSFATQAGPRYPRRLLDLCDAPPVLYYRGRLDAIDGRVVAIVGSRAATPYGRSLASTIAADFSAFGVAVVSGLARGVDAAAHRGALRADAPTVAVIGSGLQALYPPYHKELAREIVAGGGAIVSKFPPTMAARPHQFPMRNRVVAALADATVVVEAGCKSGALITARLAEDLGRHVFALPGDVGRATSEGTNGLIKDGVSLATGASDIAGVLGWGIAISRRGSEQVENALLAALAVGGSSIDELCVKTGLVCADAAAQLTMLEMQGAVERLAGGLYRAVAARHAANAARR
jgi:DNA processing protein